MSSGSGIVKGFRVGRQGGSPRWQADSAEPAEQVRVPYTCGAHSFSVPFAADADLPETWPCPRCGVDAGYVGADPVAAMPVRRPVPGGKSEWEQLMGRRTREEGEQILADALAKLARLRMSGQVKG